MEMVVKETKKDTEAVFGVCQAVENTLPFADQVVFPSEAGGVPSKLEKTRARKEQTVELGVRLGIGS